MKFFEHKEKDNSQISWEGEKKFIDALKKGEEWAYRRLYREYAPKIGSFAKTYFGTDDVDDIVQEVMLRIFKGIKKFKGNSSLSTWIYKITLNVCNTYYEKFKKKSEKVFSVENDEEDIEADIPDKEKDVQKEVESELLYEKINKVLEKLPENERILIKLRDIDEMSYLEIADILSIPEGTVKSRLHNARKKFKKILKEEGIV
ncbi:MULTISPECIES: RNA polymerase sigma factor [unclassified Thermosipho (in: thermotogales)]|uniref:RNA polymerase sigma factor n=1 Tax=unclassified Thermosipho (in: thermotogales) TaxID=2676525 RepID=UPI00098602E0|nr:MULTISPECIES: RNA polymerase sigma factor [unclassified Thermosipho (in: thermotogales)]MBT1247073.1 RNA polymerase subunit sigma-70 [Thermosipho sp. 1244]OOC46871.1 RNA polymerase sigma 70 [Thermosipho sp. 1223]